MASESNHWLSCGAVPGNGGLGQHFEQLIHSSRNGNSLGGYFFASESLFSEEYAHPIRDKLWQVAAQYTPLRYSPGWKSFTFLDRFDFAVSKRIRPTSVNRFSGFGGQSLHTFKSLRRSGSPLLELVAANSHVDNVAERHRRAIQEFPIESSWLNAAQINKTKREYEIADQIQVTSGYSRDTFVAAGIASEKIIRVDLLANPRFSPATKLRDDDTFRVIYVGSLTVPKGIPILVEAFHRLTEPRARLTLVGGWATRGMRKYLEASVSRDPRVNIVQGDPLPHLQSADVYVHPSYEDGFAYSAAEALACGLYTIVTSDTGMKDLIVSETQGLILEAGQISSLTQALKSRCEERLRS